MYLNRFFVYCMVGAALSSCSNAIIGRGSAASSKANGSPSTSSAYIRAQLQRAKAKEPQKAKAQVHPPVTSQTSPSAIFTPGQSGVLKVDLGKLSGQFRYPTDGYLLSPYGMRSGRMHKGVDIKAQTGDKVYAIFDGEVILSKMYSSYGNCVVIRHYNGFETLYAHNSRLKVFVGEKVKGGQVIALAGSTGRSTGSHLHFEVKVYGQAINPDFIIDCKSKKLKKHTLYCVNRGGKVVVSLSSIHNFETTLSGSRESGASLKKYHTMAKGDTLWSIAQRNNTTVAKLCKINNITTKTTLLVGRKILLP